MRADESSETEAQDSRPRLPPETRILAASGFFVAVGFGLIAPALPAFAASFHVQAAAIAMVVSAYSFSRLCFASVSGRLVSWLGARWVYLAGIVVVAISTTGCAFAHSYAQLLVIRALGGAGAATFHVAALSMLIRFAPPQLRGRGYALWQGSFLLGMVSGPLLGSLLMGVSLRLPFVLYGVLLGIAACVVWIPLRRSPVAALASQRGPALPVLRALRHPTYQASLLSNFVNGWMVHGIRVSVLPLFVTVQLHRGHALAGVGLSAFAAGYGGILLVLGRSADVWGRKPMACLGLAVSALGTAAIGFTASAPAFLIASTAAGLGAGLLHPAHGAAVADVIGSRASGATVLAGCEMASDAGAIAGPAAAGVLAERVSFQLAFTVTALMAGCALLMWLLRARETRSRQGDQLSAAALDDFAVE